MLLKNLENHTYMDSSTLHTAIQNNFIDYDLNNLQLQNHTEEIFILLSQLPSIATFKFLQFIDRKFPGLSFHFIMESVNFIYLRSDLCYKKFLFSFRASYYMACFPEKQMLMPIRTRLCQDLLFKDIDKNFFINFQQKMHDVQKREFITQADKKLIKKNLYIEYLQHYIRKLTVDCLYDNTEEHID